ncbi:hypothetical protein RHMOL_Rhmol13G0076700 [Rhododendron molle]|uniref:Uncharacterized protein n=1 Tax=Rhododendron molle TaxID=49168 RepID=A0ACC0L4K2_RHOML|nr:hypothetical protein RHMOL_Rhmol13G0076700 [Rhododendron molle]
MLVLLLPPVSKPMYSSPQLPLARVPTSTMDRPESGELESSLLQLINDHHHHSLSVREHTEKAKKEAIRSAVRVSDLLVDAVNQGVQESFVNEKRIELETRALAVTVMRFAKQTDQWLAASHTINTAVKVHDFVIQTLSVLATIEEIGDFENWMKTMEFDCKSISAAICNIHQA